MKRKGLKGEFSNCIDRDRSIWETNPITRSRLTLKFKTTGHSWGADRVHVNVPSLRSLIYGEKRYGGGVIQCYVICARCLITKKKYHSVSLWRKLCLQPVKIRRHTFWFAVRTSAPRSAQIGKKWKFKAKVGTFSGRALSTLLHHLTWC